MDAPSCLDLDMSFWHLTKLESKSSVDVIWHTAARVEAEEEEGEEEDEEVDDVAMAQFRNNVRPGEMCLKKNTFRNGRAIDMLLT